MKKPWDPIRLTVLSWDGSDPVPGDEVRTKTGRRYMILRVVYGSERTRSGQVIRALECLVLPKDDPVDPDATIFTWTWGPRASQARRARRALALNYGQGGPT